jgi:hypothetical protein
LLVTVYVTVPVPVPDELVVTHAAPLDAVHEHPAPAVTVNDEPPAEFVKLWPGDDSE